MDRNMRPGPDWVPGVVIERLRPRHGVKYFGTCT